MGVQIGEYLRYGLVNQRIQVDGIHILVVNDVQQVVEAVAARIDDVEAVAGEMVGIKGADEYADDHTQGHEKRHEAAVFILFHNRRG